MSTYNSTLARATRLAMRDIDKALDVNGVFSALSKEGWTSTMIHQFAKATNKAASIVAKGSLKAGSQERTSVRQKNVARLEQAIKDLCPNCSKMSRPQALKVVAERMAEVEHGAVTQTAQKSLRELGYRVKTKQRGKNSAIEVTGRNHEKAVVIVENKGAAKGVSITTEWAGIADKGCLKRQKEFEKKMEDNGVLFPSNKAVEQRHYDPRGGQLIASAGKMHAEDLAEGALLYIESLYKASTAGSLYKAPNCQSRGKVAANG
jgi:hypothetical protein